MNRTDASPQVAPLGVGKALTRDFGGTYWNLSELIASSTLIRQARETSFSVCLFVLVGLGVGIGAALFFDGRLYGGRDGLAGELGHSTVEETGDPCSCGNQGCLELYSSASAIARRVCSELKLGVSSSVTQELGGNLDQLSVEVIVAAAKSHDRLAERVLSDAGTHLGTALADMVNLLNPEKVILAGKVPQVAGDILLGPLLYNLRQRALPYVVKDLEVVVSQLGEEAAAVGSTLMAGEEVLTARCRELGAA